LEAASGKTPEGGASTTFSTLVDAIFRGASEAGALASLPLLAEGALGASEVEVAQGRVRREALTLKRK
jgi:hypothetical protein